MAACTETLPLPEYGTTTYSQQFFQTGYTQAESVKKIDTFVTGYRTSDDIIQSPTKFFYLVSGLVPYHWQCLLLNDENQEVAVRVGRQGGKSETVAIKALHTALITPKFNILIVSPTLEQSRIIFTKIEEYMHQFDFISNYVRRNTRTEIHFKNGSKIFVKAGTSVRGHTIDLLIIDEAAFVDETVFVAAEPALIARGGKVILISTPFGKIGKFYEAFADGFCSTYHIPASRIPHIDKEMLARQKEKLSTHDYAREYDANFIEGTGAYFTIETIRANCFVWNSLPIKPRPFHDYFLGVDVARAGNDETVYAIWEVSQVTKTARLLYVFADELEKTPGPHIQKNIEALDSIWSFQNIALDATGPGGYLADYAMQGDLPITPIVFNKKSPILGERSHKTEMFEKWKLDMQKNEEIRKFNGDIMIQYPLTKDFEENKKIRRTWKRKMKRYILMMKSEPRLMTQMSDLTFVWQTGGNLTVEASTERIHDDYCDAAALGYYGIFISPYREVIGAEAFGKR